MALRETRHTAETDLFRQELANLINLRHPLVQLAEQIDWAACEQRFGGLYASGVGRPGHPIRLMVGLQLLKHSSNLSDEEVVAVWVENPYWQHFCGEQYFRHDFPIDPSLMTGFRKRIGETGGEFILGLHAPEVECIEQAQRVSNVSATEVYTDRGYRGHPKRAYLKTWG